MTGNLDEPEVQPIMDGEAESGTGYHRPIVTRVLAAVWIACATRLVPCQRATELTSSATRNHRRAPSVERFLGGRGRSSTDIPTTWLRVAAVRADRVE